MANKRIKDLPVATDTVTGDIVAIDGATTRGITVENFLKDNLVAIKGLTSAADKGIQFTGTGTAATYDLTAAGKALLDDVDAAAQRTTMGVVIGTNVQAYDAGLQSISGLTTAADKMIYTTASDTYAVTTLTPFARTILDDTDQATVQTTLGLVPGTDVQEYDADLTAVAGLSSTGLIARTGDGTASVREITAPAAGITVTDGDGVLGDPTLALANDLAAVEGLSGTGIARRTGSDTWSVGTAVANSELATMSDSTFKGNVSGGSAVPSDLTVTQVLDAVGSTRGSILYRGASSWSLLTPGTSGQVLTSNGAGADPNYQDAAGGGGGSDTDRRNALLTLIYQSKVFAVYRRVVNTFATGWKGSTDTDYGINTGSSSNYAVTPGSAGAITGYVAPTTTPGTNQVPTMTSNTTPSGVASASPSLTGGTAYQAFDNNGSTAIYWNVGNLPGILQYQFTAGKVITSYTLRLNTATDTVAIGGWKSWTFDGSNDGSSWTTLDTRTSVTLVADTDNSFSFSNSTSYTYYRWRVTTGGSTRASLNIATMLDPPTTNNMTVVTTSQTTDASVSNARALLEYDNSASPTLNTDLIAEVTCDGGSNWSTATLSSVTANDQAGRSVAETADTSCTAGTSFAARIKTANAKDVKIYGASVVVH